MKLTNFESLTDSVNDIKDLVALDTKILNTDNNDLLDQSLINPLEVKLI